MGIIENILQGAYDIHVHTGPDVVKRKLSDVEMAQDIIESGMKGYVIKSHYFNTAARAAIIREVFPECNAIGAVVLNNAVGGINPNAVEMAARGGTKVVWMCTMDAKNMWDYLERSGDSVPFGSASTDPDEVKKITVFDENGKISDAVKKVLCIIKKYDMVLGTGHLSPEESLAVLRVGKEMGLTKMIATHVEFKPTYADIEMQKKYVETGAFIEHNYVTVLNGDYTIQDLAEQIRVIGAEHVVISTDMGQNINPKPLDGMKAMVKGLLEQGITEQELHQMLVFNTKYLME